MPRVTREQAEAAADLLGKAAWTANVGVASLMAVERAEATLRAYLAQRPDEDTVRKGHEFADELADHDSECYVASGCSGTCRSARAKAAIRAAMYQPEEEA